MMRGSSRPLSSYLRSSSIELWKSSFCARMFAAFRYESGSCGRSWMFYG
jgi:hypothetical protein